MTYSVAILYPNKDDIVFDKEYYLNKHIPLLEQSWGTSGLLRWEVVEYGLGPDGLKPVYAYGCTLTWKDKNSFLAATTTSDISKILEDIPRFSNQLPVQLAGPVLAESGNLG